MRPNSSERENKRARFTAPSSRQVLWRVPLLVGVSGMVLLTILLILGPRWAGRGQPVPSNPLVVPTAQGDAIRIPLATLDDGLAHFYSYSVQGARVRFFVIRTSDGVVRAALDACDICYLAGKGYRQEGDEMVCNNCGRRFPTRLIGEVYGGCNPVPLRARVEADTVVISVQDLAAGVRYFP